MKRLTTILLSALAIVFSVGITAAQQDKAEKLYQEGLYQMEGMGDYTKAIEVFNRVVAEFPKDKPVAAKALLHAGLCYEKLGKSEAQKAYEKVIKEFADQREVVAEARVRLAKLNQLAAPKYPEPVVRRVLSGTTVDPMGAPSLDGRYLAQSDWSTGDLALYDLASNQLRRLTNKGSWMESTEFAILPRFSQDGRQIAYGWFTKNDTYQLRVISTEGGEPRVLFETKQVEFVSPVGWSPDGQQILAAVQKSDETSQAVSISVGDGSVRVIKTFTREERRSGGGGWPSLSPDGRYVVYDMPQKASAAEGDVYILSTDGKLSAPLVEHPADDFNPVWTADGKRILFASDRRGTPGLWALEVVDGKPRGAPELVRAEIGRLSPMGFTQKGALYYSLPAGMFDVHVAQLDVDAGKVVEGPSPIKARKVGTNTSPAWSPDGKYLAFYTRAGLVGGPYARVELSIQSTETGQQRNFPLNLNIMPRPEWSPDGRSIVLPGSDNQWTPGVYRVDAQSGAVEKLFEAGRGVNFRWTQFLSDGKRLLFERQGLPPKTSSIIVRNLDTGEEKELVRAVQPATFGGVRLSPDGQRIGFIWREGAQMQSLRVVPVEGGEVRELFKKEKMTWMLGDFRWTPDGNYILTVQTTTPAAQQEESPENVLWRVSVNTGEAQRLGLAMKRMGSLALHPDGKRLAFTAGEQKFEVWVMENLLSKEEIGAKYNIPLLRQVWSGPDVNNLGAPSPDGRYLSYMDEQSGDLALRDLITGEKRRLTNKGSWAQSIEFALNSVPSPDGKQVAYTWFNKDRFFDLRVVGLDGSEPRVLYSNPEVDYLAPGNWSPDGKRVLALITRRDNSHQIVLVSVADGSLHELRKFDWGASWHARFSPDGRFIAYDFPQQRGSRDNDIFIIAVNGGRETAVVRHAANDLAPEWTPDGKRILFGSDRTGSMSLWSIQIADGKPVGKPQLIKTDLGRDLSPMGVTQVGGYYYGVRTGLVDVYTGELDLETGKLVGSPKPVTERFVGSNNSPDWSPDGRELVFLSRRGFGAWGARTICVHSSESGKVRELQSKLDQISWIRWSPDGRSFLANAQTSEGFAIHRVNIQTCDFSPVVQTRIGWPAVWSRDNKSIFYIAESSAPKGWQIVERDLETGQEKELHRLSMPSYYSGGVALSRDGLKLAFVVTEAETQSLVLKVVSAAGGEARELMHVKQSEVSRSGGIVWAPDGRYVLFVRDGYLWRVSAQGGEAQKLGAMIESTRDLHFHPDGRRIAFVAGQDKHEVWVMENFLPKEKEVGK